MIQLLIIFTFSIGMASKFISPSHRVVIHAFEYFIIWIWLSTHSHSWSGCGLNGTFSGWPMGLEQFTWFYIGATWDNAVYARFLVFTDETPMCIFNYPCSSVANLQKACINNFLKSTTIEDSLWLSAAYSHLLPEWSIYYYAGKWRTKQE